MRRVGYLSAGGPITDDSPTSGPVINGLKRLGWIEGSTIRFERRAANGELSRLPSLVNELVAKGVEAILTSQRLHQLQAEHHPGLSVQG
jgi:hypothetical protein